MEVERTLFDTLLQLNPLVLDVSLNGIEDSVCYALVTSLAHCSPLPHRINLSSNSIGDEGCRVLTSVFMHRGVDQVMSLDLSCNKIGVQGLVYVLDLLACSETLTVDLSGNQIPRWKNGNVDMLEHCKPYISSGRLKCELHEPISSWIASLIGRDDCFIQSIMYPIEKDLESLDMIGKGAFGRVFSLNDEYAVKLLNPVDKNRAGRVINELKIWSQMSCHENVVRFVGLVPPTKSDGDAITMAFVMEKYEMNVQQYLKENQGMNMSERL
jgi:hypothetical protein